MAERPSHYRRIFVPEGQPPESQPGEPLRVNVLFKHVQKMLTGDSAVIAETGDSWFNCQKLKLPQGCGLLMPPAGTSSRCNMGPSAGRSGRCSAMLVQRDQELELHWACGCHPQRRGQVLDRQGDVRGGADGGDRDGDGGEGGLPQGCPKAVAAGVAKSASAQHVEIRARSGAPGVNGGTPSRSH